jgi:lipopolysaccharide/colanic/teichoic acid biosynthesis glycosyltransferase
MKMAYRHGGKRFFDLGFAAAGLVLFLFPMAWIAYRIWSEMGPPIFFSQVRVGYGGENFIVWKFRTLSQDGNISRFGKALRATAMDELPQLLNILKGEMSFVGPRPLIPEELTELHTVPQGFRRFSVRPGLAGLAQLYSGKTPSLQERLGWDLGYVDRSSFGLDLKILIRSLWVTFRSSWEQPGPKMLSMGKAT